MSRFQCCFTPELVSGEDSPKETPQVGFTFSGNTHLPRLTPQALSRGCIQGQQADAMARSDERACRTNRESWWHSPRAGMGPSRRQRLRHSKDAHGIRRCPWAAMAGGLRHLSNRLRFRSWLGKPFCRCPLLPALRVDESKQLRVSSASPKSHTACC